MFSSAPSGVVFFPFSQTELPSRSVSMYLEKIGLPQQTEAHRPSPPNPFPPCCATVLAQCLSPRVFTPMSGWMRAPMRLPSVHLPPQPSRSSAGPLPSCWPPPSRHDPPQSRRHRARPPAFTDCRRSRRSSTPTPGGRGYRPRLRGRQRTTGVAPVSVTASL